MKIFQSGLVRLIATYLLTVYSLVVGLNIIHQWMENGHANQHELCVPEIENDPCHLLLVHSKTEIGCNHEAHVQEVKESCDLCDVTLLKYHIKLNQYPGIPEINPGENPIIDFDTRLFSTVLGNSHPRGPPQNS